jgi:hypothetical protein
MESAIILSLRGFPSILVLNDQKKRMKTHTRGETIKARTFERKKNTF